MGRALCVLYVLRHNYEVLKYNLVCQYIFFFTFFLFFFLSRQGFLCSLACSGVCATNAHLAHTFLMPQLEKYNKRLQYSFYLHVKHLRNSLKQLRF